MSICLMSCSYLCDRVLRMMLFHEWLNIRDGMQSFGLDKWLVCRFCISRRLMFLLLVVLCNILVLFVRLLFHEIVELLHEICWCPPVSAPVYGTKLLFIFGTQCKNLFFFQNEFVCFGTKFVLFGTKYVLFGTVE